ncbi:aldose 1-epimerase [uncultured Oscillibacter sp.]|uniref:aldose 1-epimerase n=1 Tax=uncultured Oscillibacter sp. TaxID=876091 RepID=UPI0028059D27|nr:aldose 1-epimerase [uncultured Oscillibacter sp.]
MNDVISLTHGPWRALVVPGCGLNTVSLTCRGAPILRPPPSLAALEAEPCLYGIPLLLPPNRTGGGTFSFGGTAYRLPVNEPQTGNHLHGLLCRAPFTVTERTEHTLSAVYVNDGACFPFPFSIRGDYTLSGGGFSQTFSIRNTGGADMPLTFGLHTVFAEQPRFRVPISRRWAVDGRHLPTGALLPLTAQEQSYRQGTHSRGRSVRGFFTAAGSTAQIGAMCYTVSPLFDQWVLWNGDGQSGFCAIEPLQGAVNALNSGVGLRRLRPGETIRYTTRIHPAP